VELKKEKFCHSDFTFRSSISVSRFVCSEIPQPQTLKSQISFFCIVAESMLMEELWLIIAIAVGIISIAVAIAFLTRKKKQAIQDCSFVSWNHVCGSWHCVR
jgi:hypothetical protein